MGSCSYGSSAGWKPTPRYGKRAGCPFFFLLTGPTPRVFFGNSRACEMPPGAAWVSARRAAGSEGRSDTRKNEVSKPATPLAILSTWSKFAEICRERISETRSRPVTCRRILEDNLAACRCGVGHELQMLTSQIRLPDSLHRVDFPPSDSSRLACRLSLRTSAPTPRPKPVTGKDKSP